MWGAWRQGPGRGSRVETGLLPSHPVYLCVCVCVSLSLLPSSFLFHSPPSPSSLGLNGSSSICILGRGCSWA